MKDEVAQAYLHLRKATELLEAPLKEVGVLPEPDAPIFKRKPDNEDRKTAVHVKLPPDSGWAWSTTHWSGCCLVHEESRTTVYFVEEDLIIEGHNPRIPLRIISAAIKRRLNS